MSILSLFLPRSIFRDLFPAIRKQLSRADIYSLLCTIDEKKQIETPSKKVVNEMSLGQMMYYNHSATLSFHKSTMRACVARDDVDAVEFLTRRVRLDYGWLSVEYDAVPTMRMYAKLQSCNITCYDPTLHWCDRETLHTNKAIMLDQKVWGVAYGTYFEYILIARRADVFECKPGQVICNLIGKFPKNRDELKRELRYGGSFVYSEKRVIDKHRQAKHDKFYSGMYPSNVPRMYIATALQSGNIRWLSHDECQSSHFRDHNWMLSMIRHARTFKWIYDKYNTGEIVLKRDPKPCLILYFIRHNIPFKLATISNYLQILLMQHGYTSDRIASIVIGKYKKIE